MCLSCWVKVTNTVNSDHYDMNSLDLVVVSIKHVRIPQTILVGVFIGHVRISQTILVGVSIEHVRISQTILVGVSIGHVRISQTILVGVSIEHVRISQTILVGVSIEHVRISQTILVGVSIGYVRILQTMLAFFVPHSWMVKTWFSRRSSLRRAFCYFYSWNRLCLTTRRMTLLFSSTLKFKVCLATNNHWRQEALLSFCNCFQILLVHKIIWAHSIVGTFLCIFVDISCVFIKYT